MVIIQGGCQTPELVCVFLHVDWEFFSCRDLQSSLMFSSLKAVLALLERMECSEE